MVGMKPWQMLEPLMFPYRSIAARPIPTIVRRGVFCLSPFNQGKKQIIDYTTL